MPCDAAHTRGVRSLVRPLSTSVVALLALTAGCGVQPFPTEEPFSVTEERHVPQDGPAARSVVHPVGKPLKVIVGGADYVVAGGPGGAFRIVGDDVRTMPRIDATGGRLSAPPLVAAAPRSVAHSAPATGVLVAANTGVMQDFTDSLVDAPALAALGTSVSALDAYGAGADEAIWAGLPGGVARVRKGGAERWSFGEEKRTPTAVLQVDVGLTLVAFPDALYALRPLTGALTLLTREFGTVVAMARTDHGEVVAISEHGLFTRNGTGGWRHDPLRASGESALSGLAFDPLNGLFLADESGLLLRSEDGSTRRIGTFTTQGGHALAVDGFGDVWATDGDAVKQLRVGSPVTYVNQVKPFLARRCYSCHVSGTSNGSPGLPLDDFDGTRGLVETIVSRVSGQGGAVMPPSGQLPASEYGVLVRWARSGLQP